MYSSLEQLFTSQCGGVPIAIYIQTAYNLHYGTVTDLEYLAVHLQKPYDIKIALVYKPARLTMLPFCQI